MGDPDGDMILEFEGRTWMVKEDVVSAHFHWINTAFPDRAPGSHIVFSGISGGTQPEVFAALLEFLHTHEFRGQTWEVKPSFLTYVEAYFAAECLGIETLKAMMVECVENLSKSVLSLRDTRYPRSRAATRREEMEHLESFVDAIVSVETHKWSARIQKAMYDAGERLKDRLLELPAFRHLAEGFPAGKCFARAIGLEHL